MGNSKLEMLKYTLLFYKRLTMLKLYSLFILFTLSLFAFSNESKVCQKCHPIIYEEYYDSAHRKSSIYNNPLHKAYWDKHPKDAKGYTCAKCHTPTDKVAVETGVLTDNSVQEEEPISCVFCHTIKDVDQGEMSNNNISSGEKKAFFTAEASKKGSNTASFETKSSWFGLVKTSKSSPYHKIDYNNENYYNGNVCMGCHSHTNNEHGFDTVMLDAMIDKDDKNSCISCHMPQVLGSKVTLKDSKTHAYHGIAGIYHMNREMGKYINFKVTKKPQGFTVTLTNKSNHALFGQALREGVLNATITQGDKELVLAPFIFTRLLGDDQGKERMPWNATETLKDTLIYAKKEVNYETPLQKGDKLTLSLGVRLITKKGAKDLGLEENPNMRKLRVLKVEKFEF